MNLMKKKQKNTNLKVHKITMKKLKKQVKGITLIALVVTIIVLLILAGVALSLTVGNNGLFRRAQNAADTWQMAEQNEQSEMDKVTDTIDEVLNRNDIEQVTDNNPGILEQDETDTNIYIINSIEDLVFFANDVTNGNDYEGKTVKLGQSLDFNSIKSYVDPYTTDYEKYGYSGQLKKSLTSGEGLKPIGSLDGEKCFAGIFDGNNYVIYSLLINISSDETIRVGLFPRNKGIIKNLGVANIGITVESMEGLIVGGICGQSYNNIDNCFSTGKIKAIGSGWTTIGGICGAIPNEENYVNIDNCYNLTNLEAENIKETWGSADIGCGGILGVSLGKANINKCCNSGNIITNSGNNTSSVAGICGSILEGTIKNCYNTGIIRGTSNQTQGDWYLGGIVAQMRGSEIKNCYNTGTIIANSKNKVNLFIGGIVAIQVVNGGVIENVYNLGEIKLENQNYISIGGIIGKAQAVNLNLVNAYNTGKIAVEIEEVYNVGGIARNEWISK